MMWSYAVWVSRLVLCCSLQVHFAHNVCAKPSIVWLLFFQHNHCSHGKDSWWKISCHWAKLWSSRSQRSVHWWVIGFGLRDCMTLPYSYCPINLNCRQWRASLFMRLYLWSKKVTPCHSSPQLCFSSHLYEIFRNLGLRLYIQLSANGMQIFKIPHFKCYKYLLNS